jgi:hypothetical protein
LLKKLIIREGERDRRERITLGPAEAAAPGAQSASSNSL